MSAPALTGQGRLWVWGVDVSTKRLAIGCDGPDVSVHLREFDPRLKTGARLCEIYRWTRNFAAELAKDRPPLFVWVEQPASYGRIVEPQLMYAVGVVQAALYDALEQRNAFPTEVRTVAVAEWKKASVGHGNADKAQVLEWAKADGFETDHVCRVKKCTHSAHDRADAWAIARAGSALLGMSGENPLSERDAA